MSAEIRRLLERWRELGTALPGYRVMAGYEKAAQTLMKCADELDALLTAAPAAPSRDEDTSRLIELSDKHRHDGGEVGELIALFEAQILATYYRTFPAPAAPQEERGWRDIATAPKDGTQVWAWDDERGSNPALWLTDGDVWVITYDDAEIKPTHWMPLPSPPVVREEENTKKEIT
jgi:hypothetical protein